MTTFDIERFISELGEASLRDGVLYRVCSILRSTPNVDVTGLLASVMVIQSDLCLKTQQRLIEAAHSAPGGLYR